MSDATDKSPRPLSGPVSGPAAGGRPEWLVVLLLGVGADGDDLIGLAPELADALPTAAFVAPNGPEPCDMAPVGRQWFSLMTRDAQSLERGVRRAAVDVDGFLADTLKKEGLGSDRLILLGFSQGAMTALHVGLRGSMAPAGVIALSGALLAAESLAAELRHRPPVLIIHGDADPVMPVIAAAHARDLLGRAGLDPETRTVPDLGHGIDDRVISMVKAFLKRLAQPRSV